MLTDEEFNDLAATIIGESGHGVLALDQQMAIAWTYYNRLTSKYGINKTFDACIGNRFSYAYERLEIGKPTVDVMVVMVALGNRKHAKDSAEGQYVNGTIQDLIDKKFPEIEKYIKRGKTLKIEMIKQFATPWNNKFPGYTNQGYHVDFNAPTYGHFNSFDEKINSKDQMWAWALAYYWLQKDGKVPDQYEYKFVTELYTKGAENSTTFIIKLPKIESYFKSHPDQLPKVYRDVPKYDPINNGAKTFRDIYGRYSKPKK